jgi:hypothetical protein
MYSDMLRGLGPFALMFDGAHSCVINAQHSVGAWALEDGRILLCKTSSDGSAGSREAQLLGEGMDKILADGGDLRLTVIDQNATNGAVIRRRMKVNAPTPEIRSSAQEEGWDIWHCSKSVPKKIVKSVDQNAAIMKTSIRKISEYLNSISVTPSGHHIAEFVALVRHHICARFDVYFKPMTDKFAALPREKFAQCIASADEMMKLGKEVGAVADASLHTTVLTELNQLRGDKQYNAITSFRVADSSVGERVAVVCALHPESEIRRLARDPAAYKAERLGKVVFGDWAKARAAECPLPPECRIGLMQSTKFVDAVGLADVEFRLRYIRAVHGGSVVAEELPGHEKEILQQLAMDGKKNKEDRQCTKGGGYGSIKGLRPKHLNADQLKHRAAYLQVQDSTLQPPSECKLYPLEIYCKRHLPNPMRDAEESLAMAATHTKAIRDNGKSSFRHSFNQFFRLVNEHYGGFSKDFKVYWVGLAMRNWIRHWCDDHTCCASFVWYSRCHRRDASERTKISDLEKQFSGISAFFGLFSLAYIHSKELEKVMYAACLHLCTRTLESLFHKKNIFIPKWAGGSHQHYTMKVYAAWLDMNSQKEEKKHGAGSIRNSKWGVSLVRNQKTKKERPQIVAMTDELLGSCCPNTAGACRASVARAEKSKERKQQRDKDAHNAKKGLMEAITGAAIGTGERSLTKTIDSTSSRVGRTQGALPTDIPLISTLQPFPRYAIQLDAEGEARRDGYERNSAALGEQLASGGRSKALAIAQQNEQLQGEAGNSGSGSGSGSGSDADADADGEGGEGAAGASEGTAAVMGALEGLAAQAAATPSLPLASPPMARTRTRAPVRPAAPPTAPYPSPRRCQTTRPAAGSPAGAKPPSRRRRKK